jgi:pyruvate ferredoxin oxidoreductase alpha subunit
MKAEMMTGNLAAAWGARLADVDYVPAFPITPQTEIVEALSKWCAHGSLNARFVTLDSEHSMMTAAGAASATGARVFTATSSQGLLHAFEVLYTVAGFDTCLSRRSSATRLPTFRRGSMSTGRR